MDPATKSTLFETGGKVLSAVLKITLSRPENSPPVATVSPKEAPTEGPRPQPAPTRSIALPTADQTTVELKRRLAKELYRAELDLAAGLKIANRPCDCLGHKHALMLEAASEELVSQDPGNSVYQDIIFWIRTNQPKVTTEAIASGQYASEYPRMANEFKNFRKRVMGSVGIEPTSSLTLEQAQELAAEEARKEVSKQWVHQISSPLREKGVS